MYHGYELYKAGIAYHSTGTIKSGRKVLAYYYKLCNPITAEQLQAIQAVIPEVTTGDYRAQYAPEITGKVLVIKSKAQILREYRQIKREKITAKSTGNDVAKSTGKSHAGTHAGTNHNRSAN